MYKFGIVMLKIPVAKLMVQHRNNFLMRHAFKNIIIHNDLFAIEKTKEVGVNFLWIFGLHLQLNLFQGKV